MKRGYLLFLTLCVGIMTCSGCTKKNQELEKKEVRQEKGKEQQNATKTGEKDNKDDGKKTDDKNGMGDVKKGKNQGDVLGYLKGIIGEKHVLLMEPVAENILLVVTEKKAGAEVRVVDISEKKILSATKKVHQGIGYRCQSYKSHFILRVLTRQDAGIYPIYYIFDHRYQMTDTIDVRKERGDEADNYGGVCILPGKKKTVFEKEKFGKEDYYELRIGNYSLEKGRKIYRVDGNRTNCTHGMEEMAAGTDESTIFYLGRFYKDMNEQTRNCYGCLDIKSGKITMRHEERTEQEYSKKMLVVGDEAYFYDGLIVEDENYTGKVYCMDASGKTEVWKLKNKREGECIISSDGGKYLATYYIDDEKENTYKTVVHIYDRKTKKEMAKKVLNVYADQINIFDDGRILATYADNVKTCLMETEWKAGQ